MKLHQLPLKLNMKAMFLKEGSLWVKAFETRTGLCMMYSLDKTQHGDLHHMSISRRDRYPQWDEIVEAKQILMGDVDTMMIIPKKRDYVNVHTNCFYVWETPEDWNVL